MYTKINSNKIFNKVFYFLLLCLGLYFIVYYILKAGCNVVYTDYIREINIYISQQNWIKSFLNIEIFTKAPLAIFFKKINILFFHYNTFFDMFLGVIGLFLSVLVINKYCIKMSVNIFFYISCLVLFFSLNQWEMLLNGTGWIHFWAFAFFYYNYYLIDLFFIKKEKTKIIFFQLMFLPIITILFISLFYSAVYCLVLLLVYLYLVNYKKINYKEFSLYIFTIFSPLFIYLLSVNYSKIEYSIGKENFFTALFQNPLYFIKFFLISFSSVIFGNETFESIGFKEYQILLIGGMVLVFYFLTFYNNFKYKIIKKTIFPIICIVAGFFNHMIILYSRFGFKSIYYGASSRYMLQYRIGIIGIILTIAILFISKKLGKLERFLYLFFVFFVLFGNFYTTLNEFKKAQYRKAYLEKAKEIGLNYKNENEVLN